MTAPGDHPWPAGPTAVVLALAFLAVAAGPLLVVGEVLLVLLAVTEGPTATGLTWGALAVVLLAGMLAAWWRLWGRYGGAQDHGAGGVRRGQGPPSPHTPPPQPDETRRHPR